MRRSAIVGTALALVAIVMAIGASLAASPTWNWSRGLWAWIAAGVVAVVGAVLLARPPTLRMRRWRVGVTPVSMTAHPRRPSPLTDTILGVELHARVRSGLTRCAARLVSLEPKDQAAFVPPTPLRLLFAPGGRSEENIAYGAREIVEVVRLEHGISATIFHADLTDLPYGLAPGRWSCRLQITAEGYAAAFFDGEFVTEREEGSSCVEWSSLRRHRRRLPELS